MTKGDVVGESRELLHKTWTEIDGSREDLAKVVWKGMDEDRILGPCKVCEEAGRTKEDGSPNMLRIIRAKKSGKRFVGCSGWTARRSQIVRPDLPAAPARRRLPARGALLDLRPDAAAESRQPFRGRPWNLCLNDDCESMQEMKKRRAEREAAKAAKEAMDKKPPKGDEDAPEKGEKSESQSVESRHRHARAQTRQSRGQRLRPRDVVHLPGGSGRLRQEHPGAPAGRGAGRGDGRDPRAGRDRRGRADPRRCSPTRRPSWSRWPSCCSSWRRAPTSPSG